MSQEVLGADVDGLQEIARDCNKAAQVADAVRMFLQAIVAAARMFGPWSEAFIAYLSTVVIPWLAKVAQALRLFANVLNAYASAQIKVSNGEQVDMSTLPSYTSPIAPIGDTPPGTAPPAEPAPAPAEAAPAPVVQAPAPQPQAAPMTGGGGGSWSPPPPAAPLPPLEPLAAVEELKEVEKEKTPPIVVQVPEMPAPGVGVGALVGGLAAAAAGGGLLGAAATYGIQKKLAKQDADDGSVVLGKASLDNPTPRGRLT